jgi:hypothetical protein
MKTEILSSEEITKDMALKELSKSNLLSKEEINEYLEIIIAINDNQQVFNITTNKGEYLMFIKGNAIKDTSDNNRQY